jgi:hypothetical protein
MDVHAPANETSELFTTDPFHDVAHCKIWALGIVAMQQRRGDPDLVSHFEGMARLRAFRAAIYPH